MTPVTANGVAPDGKTLADAFAAALKTSEVLATQGETVTQEEERLKQAYGAVMATISGVASEEWQQKPTNATAGSFYPSSQPLVKITGDQPLFRGFRDFAALRGEKDLVRYQADTWAADALTLYKEVAPAFYAVVQDEQDLANLLTELEYYQQWIDELNQRIKIGRSQLTDVLTVQTTMETQAAAAETLKGQIWVARDLLAFYTGWPPDVKLSNADPVPDRSDILQSYISDIPKRPDVKATEQQYGSADENIWVAKGQHLPSADLLGDYYFDRAGALSDVNWDVTAQLTIPIFSGGIIQSQVREAESVANAAETAVILAKRTAEQEIRTDYDTMRFDLSTYQALYSAYNVAEKNYLAEEANYRLGLVANIDVVTAITAFCENLRAYDRQKFALLSDQAKLEAAAARRPALEVAVPKISVSPE